MKLDSNSIPIFLHFGYLPPAEWGTPNGTWRVWGPCTAPVVDRPPPAEAADLDHLIKRGRDIFRQAFREAIAQADRGQTHVLPLSGGLDSRAILGGLLESLESRRIQAVTFGSPGTWDFEIGQQVARAAGVRCATIDLSSDGWAWDTAELVRTAQHIERPIGVFDAYVNRQVAERFGVGNVYWSGFMGDPLSGSHLPRRDSTTWDQAQRRFAEHNRFARSITLTPPGFEPEHCLPASPIGTGPGSESEGTPHGSTTNGRGLSYDEQLDFAIRQQSLTRHIVLPQGYDYRTPFLHPGWADFIVSVPRRCRQGQYLYKEILKTAYPQLFSLPTKNNLGLPLEAPLWRKSDRILVLGIRGLARRLAPNFCYSLSPGLNYADFDRSLRRRQDLRMVIRENLRDLQKRGIIDWLDVEDIERRHQHGYGNYADALLLLTSLEVNLKAQDNAPAAQAARGAGLGRGAAVRPPGSSGGTAT